MGLTFRGEKGSPLLHTELDNNFRELFYSASVSGSDLLMFRSRSLDNSVTLPLPYPKGGEYAIQLKKGNTASGSGTSFSGSQNLIHDFRQNTTKVSGSLIISSSGVTTPFQVQGSGSITGDLVVGGKVTAEEFITEYSTVAVSTIFKSGSSKFGDTLDDTHAFTGSLKLSGSSIITGSTKLLGVSNTVGTQTTTGSIELDGTLNITGSTNLTGPTLITGQFTRNGSAIITGSSTVNGNIVQTGSLDQSGSYTLNGIISHTGSYFTSGNITHIGNYTQTGNLDLSGFESTLDALPVCIYKLPSSSNTNSRDE